MWLLALSLVAVQSGSPGDPRDLVRQVAVRVAQGDSTSSSPSPRPAGKDADRLATLADATRARLTHQYPVAERLYARLLSPAEAPPDRLALYALLGQAELRLLTAPFDSVLVAFEEAARLARTLADTAAWAEALMGAAFARSRMDRPAAAEPDLDLAGRLLPPASMALHAQLACLRGMVLVQGQDPAAAAVIERGLELARRVGDVHQEGVCLRVLGSHHAYTGEVAAALVALDSAAAIQRLLRDRVELASTYRWKGWLLLNWHDYPAADRILNAALAESRAAGPPWSVGWTLRHRAALAWRFGDLAIALGLLDTAEAILARQRDGWGVTSARSLRGDVALDAGRAAEAESAFRDQIAFGERVGRPIEVYTGRLGLLHLRLRQADWAGAGEELESLRRHVRRHRQPGWNARLDYEAGVVALRRGRPDVAWRHFGAYLGQLPPDDHLAIHAARTRRAETLLAEGVTDRAVAELSAAADALDRFRSALADDHLRLLAFQGRQAYDDDAGFASVIAGLATAGRAGLALDFAERRRARVLSDRLRGAAGPPGASADARGGLLDALPDSTAMLFVHGGRRGQPTTLFLLQRSGIVSATAPGMESLEAAARTFTARLRAGAAVTNSGRQLRQALFDSLLLSLPPAVTRLVIIPDGELARLPFDALPLEDGTPLATRYAVSQAPSVSVIAGLQSQRSTDTAFRSLVVADPVFPPLDAPEPGGRSESYREAFREAGGLPRLRASGREAFAVSRFVPGADLRLREDASEAWLRQASLSDYRLIHLATHAVVSERHASRTALALAPGGAEDGFLGVEDLAALDLDADLVVLSACRTAGGVVVGGEGIQGLTAPLFEAGARAVLATRWQVGDRAAARFSQRFYRAATSGAPVAEALRLAQLAGRDAGDPPEEWAAFVLVGDGSVRLPLRPPAEPAPGAVVALLALAGLGGYGVVRVRRGREPAVRPS